MAPLCRLSGIAASRSDAAIEHRRLSALFAYRLSGLLFIPCAESGPSFDLPDWAGILQPRLAVVAHPTTEMATIAWDMLEHRMHNDDAPRRQTLLRATLIDAPSIGPPPPTGQHIAMERQTS